MINVYDFVFFFFLGVLSSTIPFILLLPRLRLWVYLRLSFASDWTPRTRIFRAGIPLVLKASDGTKSTEADALRFLNTHLRGEQLPIPILYDTFYLDGLTYTLMSKLPGQSPLKAVPDALANEEYFQTLCGEIEKVMRRVWAIPQPAHFNGQVMISASGDGIMSTVWDVDGVYGPLPSSLEFYALILEFTPTDLLERFPEAEAILAAELVVFTHTDLLLQNILVDDEGHLTGIVDWENTGWLPKSRQWYFLCRPCLYSPVLYRWAWIAKRTEDVVAQEAHTLLLKIARSR